MVLVQQYNTDHVLYLDISCCFRADHTETVEIQYDPTVTSYERLLKMFWSNHDSTTCHTRQYMSAIFYHSDEQKTLALESKEVHQKQKMKKVVTKILPAQTFYNAEK